MPIIIDIIVVLIVCSMVFIGVKKGFISSIISFFGYIISVIVASFASKFLAVYIFNTFLVDGIKEKILTAFPRGIEKNGIDSVVQNFLNTQPEILKNLITQRFNGAEGVSEVLQKNGAGVKESFAEVLATSVVGPVIITIMQFILFFVLIGVCLFLLRIIQRTLGGVKRIPVIGQFNALLGGICGLAQAVAVLMIISIALNVYLSFQTDQSFINLQTIEQTSIFRIIYNYNPFLILKGKV